MARRLTLICRENFKGFREEKLHIVIVNVIEEALLTCLVGS